MDILEGGIALSSSNESSLRFSLEESIWFQKGQEVAELISISLDPNITIQEHGPYATIRGSLELMGEYLRYDDTENEKEEMFSVPKFVQSTQERADGTFEFLHRFPVDITIPMHRVQSVYDIDVLVETFDYLLPERGCMKLSADLIITGLTVPETEEKEEFIGEQIQEREVEASTEAVANDDQHTEEKESFTEVPLNQNSEMAIEQDEAIELSNDELEMESNEELIEVLHRTAEQDVDMEPIDTVHFLHSNVPVAEAKEESSSQSSKDLFTPFQVTAHKQANDEEAWEPELLESSSRSYQWNHDPAEMEFLVNRNEHAHAQPQPVPHDHMMVNNEVNVTHIELEEKQVLESGDKLKKKHMDKEESSSSSSEVQVKKKKIKKKSLSLTEFFARKEESDVARLKVCIVQHGDTLDLLSERYDVSVQQLLRVNQLELNKDVYVGQVLYIPMIEDSPRYH